MKWQPLIKAINKDHPDAAVFLVGGAVRDQLLKKTAKDFDVMIAGVPADHLEKILARLGQVRLVGKKFGVFKFISSDSKVEIDITLPRTEKSFGTGQRRDFDIQSDPNLPIAGDLARRDFTINALAYNLKTKQYIDPFHGQTDLEAGIIRAVGQPAERFAEDYSRMLRAIRFACQLGFKIEAKTWTAIRQLMPRIKTIAGEIISAELVKMFVARPALALDLLDRAGFWGVMVPEMLEMKTCAQPIEWHSEGNVWKHTRLALEELEKSGTAIDPNLVFALLWHDIGKTVTRKKIKSNITFYEHHDAGARIARRIIKRLKLESAGLNRDWVSWLIKSHMLVFTNDPKKLKNATIVRYFLNDRYPSDLLLELIKLDGLATIPARRHNDADDKLSIIKKRLTQLKKRPLQPLLNGEEIMKLTGLMPGKKLGDTITRLRAAQIEGQVRTREKAREFLFNK